MISIFSILRGVAEKEGMTLFGGEEGGRCSFFIKYKLKSKIFNDQKLRI